MSFTRISSLQRSREIKSFNKWRFTWRYAQQAKAWVFSNQICFFSPFGDLGRWEFFAKQHHVSGLMLAALSWQTSSPSKLQIFHQKKDCQSSQPTKKSLRWHSPNTAFRKSKPLGFSRALGLISNFPWPVRTHPREHGARTGSACRVRTIRCSLRSVPCWPWASEPPRGSCADHVKPPCEARNTGNPQRGETHLMVETNLFFHEQICSFGS